LLLIWKNCGFHRLLLLIGWPDADGTWIRYGTISVKKIDQNHPIAH